MDRPWLPKLDDKLRKRVGLVSITVLIFMAAIGILFFGDAIGRFAGYSDAQAEHLANHYQNETANEINRCFARPERPSSVQECVENAVTASYENQRDERDLSAQRQMANWAWWLLIVTAVQAPLTALGLLFILITIWQGREALQTARDSAAEAKRIGEAQVRCYLSVAPPKIIIHNDGLIDLSVLAKNSGQSPARAVEVSYLVEFYSLSIDGLRQEIAGKIAGNKGQFEIAAASELSFPKQKGSEGINSEIDAAMRNGKVPIVVYILVKWEDVFDTKFEIIERFSHPNALRARDKEVVVPSERDLASAILGEVYKRKHRGEWTSETPFREDKGG